MNPEARVVRGELAAEGVLHTFERAALALNGRRLSASGAPQRVQALAVKAENSEEREVWFVDRFPFDEVGASPRGSWQLATVDPARSLEFVEWPTHFVGRVDEKGLPE